MKFLPRALVITALLVAPLAASAIPVLWNITGILIGVDDVPASPFPPEIAVGKPFSVLLGFDTAAPLTAGSGDPSNPACTPPTKQNPCPAPSGGGFQYRYNPSSITMVVNFGSLGPFSFDMAGPGKSGNFIVRDNYPGPGSLANPLVDGLTFGLTDASDPMSDIVSLQVLFRGTNTNVLDIPLTGIPATPPPGLTSLEAAVFQVTLDGPNGTRFLGGDIRSVTAVPEPATLAMMSLGLAGLAVMRRRRGSARPQA